jgi:IS5 family transposase
MAKAPKRPRDTNQLAKFIADLSTGEQVEAPPDADKDPKAVERGRLGGLKGGAARAKSLSPVRRRKIARKAASARWKA